MKKQTGPLPMNRRMFLRGSLKGIPMALSIPVLPSLLPRSAWAAPNKSQMNLFVMYIPSGTFPHSIVNQKVKIDNKMSYWFPTSTGALPAKLPRFLSRLEGAQNDFSVVSGLHQTYMGNDDADIELDAHGSISKFLSGNVWDTLAQYSNFYSPNDSIDQIIGAHLTGQNTPRSIQTKVANVLMGHAPQGGTPLVRDWSYRFTFHDHAQTFAQRSALALFEQVYGSTSGGGSNTKDVNILDVVLKDLKNKRALASSEDRSTLDRWLAGYEDVKKSLTDIVAPPNGCNISLTKPSANLSSSDFDALGPVYDATVDAFFKIFLDGMECGALRVCTIAMDAEASNSTYWDKVVATTDLDPIDGRSLTLNQMKIRMHLGMAHYGGEGADMLNAHRHTCLMNYFMRKYRAFLEGLKARNIFDNSLAVCSFGFRDGNHKDGNADFPFLCGGNGGGFKTGSHHRLTTTLPENSNRGGSTNYKATLTPLSNFWVSVLKKYGINNYTNRMVTGNTDSLFG